MYKLLIYSFFLEGRGVMAYFKGCKRQTDILIGKKKKNLKITNEIGQKSAKDYSQIH